MQQHVILRHAEASDYLSVITVLDGWWGGRHMSDMLPKLFFVHFRPTSFVAECNGNIVGFIVGFVSQTSSGEAYIHFVGVHPDFRRDGVGRVLYERFFEVTSKLGCRVVRCVTSPVNKASISFHQRLGFVVESGSKTVDGISVFENYDGVGEDRVVFVKPLNAVGPLR